MLFSVNVHAKLGLALSFAISTALAAQCPIKPVVIPEPGKCWKCVDIPGFPPGNSPTGSPYRVPESWTDFYCKYTKQDTRTSDDKPTAPIVVDCYYDANGTLGKNPLIDCPSKPTRIDGCEDVKKPEGYKGEYEICCGQDCKTETARCFHCPNLGGTWVEIDATGYNLECTYHNEREIREQVSTCTFDSWTGAFISSGIPSICSGVAPQRETCLASHPEAKDLNAPRPCPTGLKPEECTLEQKQRDNLQCKDMRNPKYKEDLRSVDCTPNSAWCSDGCSSNECLTCPVLPPKEGQKDYQVTVFVSAQSWGQVQCRYDDLDNKLGHSEAFCTYDGKTGDLSYGYARYTTQRCKEIPKAVKNLRCERLKQAANKRSI